MCENTSRTNYIYKAGDMIRIITTANDKRGKLIRFEHPGPYEITQAHNNGTITIRCGNFLERIKNRRVKRVNNKFKKNQTRWTLSWGESVIRHINYQDCDQE